MTELDLSAVDLNYVSLCGELSVLPCLGVLGDETKWLRCLYYPLVPGQLMLLILTKEVAIENLGGCFALAESIGIRWDCD